MAFRVTRPVGRNRIVARNSLPSGCPPETGARQPQAGPPAAYERSDHGPVRSGAAPLRTKLLIATRSSRPDSFWSHVHSCSDVPAQRRAAAHPSSSSLSRPHPRRIPTGRHRPVVEGERPAETVRHGRGASMKPVIFRRCAHTPLPAMFVAAVERPRRGLVLPSLLREPPMGPKPIPSDDEAKAHSFKTMPRIWTRVDTRQICETDSRRGKDAQARESKDSRSPANRRPARPWSRMLIPVKAPSPPPAA